MADHDTEKVCSSAAGIASPTPSLDGASFDEQLYLTLNPDVEAAVTLGHFTSGRAHWRQHGQRDEAEGHRPSLLHDQHYRGPENQGSSVPSPAEIAEFDPEAYLEANADVRMAIGSDPGTALNHWMEHGRLEGRLSSNCKIYLERAKSPAAIAAKPFGVNFYAPFAAKSGLGTASRGYLSALRAAGIPTHLVNLDIGHGRYRVAAREHDLPGPYRINLLQVNADSIDRLYSLFRKDRFDHAFNIAIWAWEMNILRPDWFVRFGAVDEVWTLSDFNARSVAAVAPVPVRTMNCVVPAATTTPLDRAYFNLPTGFLFLTVFDVGSSVQRKNPMAVVDAFRAAFSQREDVYLVLKFHAAHADSAALRDFLCGIHEVPRVIIRATTLTDMEMHGLQSCCDCLVSAHRSEGFGLNIAEFMQTEKPVIVTGYSGNMDFTTPDNCYLVPYHIQQLTAASGPYLPGYQWAEPDTEALTRIMQGVVNEPAEASRRGAQGAETVRTRLSPSKIGTDIQARLEELGLGQELPPYVHLLARTSTAAPPMTRATAPLSTPGSVAANPTISVIVPVYNTPPAHLENCIESVLQQTYGRWELCLCDDASSRAETLAVLGRYQGTDPRLRIRHLTEFGGIVSAANAAVEMATGAYLVMLDNDDELTPDALETIASEVIANPGLDALYADEDHHIIDGRLRGPHAENDAPSTYHESMMSSLHPVTVRTSLFLRLNGFRGGYYGSHDWDLMLRVSRETKAIHHIPRVLYHLRRPSGFGPVPQECPPRRWADGVPRLVDYLAAR